MATKKASSETVKSSGPSVLAVVPPASGMAALCDSLGDQFAERGSVIRALARAILAGEHAFMLGEPGTGKSLLARTFAQSLGLSYWERLLTRFSTPEEVFGPLSITALQQDRYTRSSKDYLPGAQIAFIDEIWKANSGILNSLLTALNERLFHDDGKPNKIPLISCVGASNELPESESELAALYDRFLVRVVVEYVSDRDAFADMVFGAGPQVPMSIPIDLKAEQDAVRAVGISPELREALVDLRYKVRDAGFRVSDRRWRQCVSLIKASAHLDGRQIATTDDLECLEDVLWRTPAERSTVARIIQSVANPDAAKAIEALDAAKEARSKLPAAPAAGSDPRANATFMMAIAECNKDLKEILLRVEALPQNRKVAEVVAAIKAIRKETTTIATRAAGLDV
jgi:MoxR-like ATPase